LQGASGFCQKLPHAPSAVRNPSFPAVERLDSASDPPKEPATRSRDSDSTKSLSRWAKRGLRDQADIYTAPFHRSELVGSTIGYLIGAYFPRALQG